MNTTVTIINTLATYLTMIADAVITIAAITIILILPGWLKRRDSDARRLARYEDMAVENFDHIERALLKIETRIANIEASFEADDQEEDPGDQS